MGKRKGLFDRRRPHIVAAILIALFGPTSTRVRALPPDPVEELRTSLKAPVLDTGERDRNLRAQIRALSGINDLQRAVSLREWRDEDPDDKVAAVDLTNRAEVCRAFEQAVRDVLHHGDAASRLAVMNILVKMATTTRGAGTKASIAHAFADDLANLTRQGDAGTREAAARALGQVSPEPVMAVPVLSKLMESKEVRLKLAAVDGMVSMMKVATYLATRNHAPNMVEATRMDVVRAGQQVVPAAVRGMSAAEPEVRRHSMQAIAQAAEALGKLVPTPQPNEAQDLAGFQRQVEAERMELLPLITTLKDEVPALTRALSDSDGEVRVLARRALEDMTSPQLVLLDRTANAGLRPSQYVSAAPAQEPILAGLHNTVLKLAAGLKDEDSRSRRTVIDVLETLGPASAPAAAALVRALSDTDPFVRWAAARTLGKISPAAADTVVPGLAGMLIDADLDLRVAAATALERYGRAAKKVVPDLIQALRSTDAEMRVAVIRALGAVGGPEAHAAIAGLTAAVADPDPRVQQAAAEVLGQFGPVARDAVPPLRRALQTGAPKVQKAAGEALLNIMRPGK